MALSNLLFKVQLQQSVRSTTPLILASRQGHTIRGKPPGVAKTIEQRLQEENAKDPELTARVNIGFPKLKSTRSEQLKERLSYVKAQRANGELEKKARINDLLIDLSEVQKDYANTTRGYDLRIIADHYGIFEDLFGAAYFVPRVNLNIQYQATEDTLIPVYNGNIIKPLEARQAPLVTFDGSTDPITGNPSTGDSYWTLIATNPDGHFTENDKEYIHWFVGNIPNGDVQKGDVIVNYLAPFPPKGVGYQRFVFVLYKQNKKIDFSSLKLATEDNVNLDKRTFKTYDFYRQHQDDITPAGLAFYQTNYDKSLTKFYHDVLNLKEPVFEYDFPEPYLADQKFFPLKQAFNLYMDRHRDIKEVNKEYLECKLSKTHPFDGPDRPLKYPNAHPIKDTPSWLKTEIRKERLKIGRINDY
ncbi:39S ribosomal protein L38, mitochondrial [Lucilia cuprina]|uniref:39S ribosomal protein L38, mitochondrial n=1 Tax=Lucilia cuprina TaxID=7375 RepID=UPI001F05775E|nr:39S ribosomal protein L38, mitochondrial [Lucilia cuprina]